ncbi:MAG: hypothetical protein DIU71_03835 [Proteobacteria bacterium]|nr:MAG: hypothetical protein DIU71_03835 [Pseudomonadota bacterium]
MNRARTRPLRGAAPARDPSLDAHPMADFFALRLLPMWNYFRKEHLSFWAACGYLFVEYVRPQSIVPAIDILPWGKLFVGLAIGAWLLDQRQKWVSDGTHVWMVCYLLVVVLACANAYWPDHAWNHFMDFFVWFLVYFLIVNIINSEKRLFLFLLLFLLASFKLSQHGARTWAMRGFSFENWGLMGPEGPFQNSGELSVQMLMFMPIAYRLAICLRPWLSRLKFWFLMAMPATAFMTVLGASSRGSQLAMGFQAYHTLLKGRLSFRVLVVAALAVAAAIAYLPEEQMNRFRDMGSDETSQQRLLYWKHGLTMIQEHPLLGVGFFNFAPYYAQHHPEDVLFGSAQLPHNIFVQVGTDAGFLGLTVYGLLILAGFRATRQIRRRLKDRPDHWIYGVSLGYDAAFIGFLIAGQFVTIGYYPFMWVLLAFIIATKNIVLREPLAATAPASSAAPASAAPVRPGLPRSLIRRPGASVKSDGA